VKPPIHSVDGLVPHKSRGNWAEFLASRPIHDRCDGVIWYGGSNCNYFLFDDGTLFTNYGYHGDALFKRIQTEGAEAVLTRIKCAHTIMRRVQEALNEHDLTRAILIAKECQTL
jgi:hypothetical protein